MQSPRGAGGKRNLAFCEGYNELSPEFHGLGDGLCCLPDGDFIFFSHCEEGKDHGCSLMERGLLGGSQGLPDKMIGSTSSYSRRTQRKSRARSCGRADNSLMSPSAPIPGDGPGQARGVQTPLASCQWVLQPHSLLPKATYQGIDELSPGLACSPDGQSRAGLCRRKEP